MDRCGQFHRHVDPRMETAFPRYGMNPAAVCAAYPELVPQGTCQGYPVCHSVSEKYVPAVRQALQSSAFFQCHIEQLPSVVLPVEGKREKQYEQQQSHRDILLNILSASSSVLCSFRLLNTSSAARSDLFLSL